MTDSTRENRWFRLYHELLRDRKIARAARVCRVERATVIGVWTGIMCLANESPERGSLFLAPNVPLTAEDMPDEIGIDPETCYALLDAFQQLDMISVIDGVYSVTHFMKRQFESDSSTRRTREYRERKRFEEQASDDDIPSQDDICDVSGTSQERHGDADVTAHSIAEHSIADTDNISALAPNQREMFGAVSEVCVVDPKLQRTRIGKVAKQLCGAGYAPKDVRAWYSAGGWWYANDWRGKQGQPPKLEQIAETIAQAQRDAPKTRSPTKKLVKMIDPVTKQTCEMEITP